MRVYLDTNVLIAAFATRGLCADVLRLVLAEHELVVSATGLEELRRNLARKLALPEDTIRDIVAFLRTSAAVVANAPVPTKVQVRDADDTIILGEALAGAAEVLVTGDRDFLDLTESPGLLILDPRAFWERHRRGHS